MFSIPNPSYKDIVLCTTKDYNCSFLYKIEKRGDLINRENVKQVNKNYVINNLLKVNNPKGNLIPTSFQYVFWTLLGSQEKFDIVMEKVIEKLDRRIVKAEVRIL